MHQCVSFQSSTNVILFKYFQDERTFESLIRKKECEIQLLGRLNLVKEL